MPIPPMPPRDSFGLPARSVLNHTGLHLGLLDIAPSELRDPFLHETVKRVPAAQSLVHVPRAELGQVPASSAPAGVIFHVARCGSTLVSQLLRLHDDLVVYAEPLAINEILVPPHTTSRADLIAALRTLGRYFAAHAQRPYVLKLSSWNTLFCDIVAEAFPQTPWALCVRDPLEVCVSLVEQQPSWLREENAALFTDLVDPARTARSVEDRIARTFAALCETASRLDPEHGLVVPYETLPGAVWGRIAPHFSLPVTEPTRQRMVEASSSYSKAPVGRTAAFTPDAERKAASASPALRQAVELMARPMYERLIRAAERSASR